MKHYYLAPEGGDPVEVELRREGDRIWFRLGGEVGEARLDRDGAGGGRLLLGGEVIPFHRAVVEGVVHVWVKGRVHTFRIFRRPPRAGAVPSRGAAGEEVQAPVPGILTRLAVTQGERVEAGQTLAVLESMKMEIVLSAPRPGVVQSVAFREGDPVEGGDVVVRLGDG